MTESFKIYCAGPLFNSIERQEMSEIANALRNSGYSVFLPHEDGLEFAQIFPAFLERGFSQTDAENILNKAIFSLDVFQIMDSDGLVLNMNGRVPDEGAMVETGIAWSFNKPIVIYNSDSRSLIQGACNPLVMGLAAFQSVSTYDEIPPLFDSKFTNQGKEILSNDRSSNELFHGLGKRINDFLTTRDSSNELADLLIDLFGENECQSTKGLCRKGVPIQTQQ